MAPGDCLAAMGGAEPDSVDAKVCEDCDGGAWEGIAGS